MLEFPKARRADDTGITGAIPAVSQPRHSERLPGLELPSRFALGLASDPRPDRSQRGGLPSGPTPPPGFQVSALRLLHSGMAVGVGTAVGILVKAMFDLSTGLSLGLGLATQAVTLTSLAILSNGTGSPHAGWAMRPEYLAPHIHRSIVNFAAMYLGVACSPSPTAMFFAGLPILLGLSSWKRAR